jgi:tetratricopeptide (TPR) repeat protein
VIRPPAPLFFAALVITSGIVRAEVSDEERARAKELIGKGDVNYRLYKFEQALADYLEAYRLTQHPAIAFNIAQAYRQLKNHKKARFYYKLFLSDWRKRYPDRPPPYEQEVERHIERLSRLISTTERRRPTSRPARTRPAAPAPAKLELEGLRAGARVLVDGRERRGGPLFSVVPGRRRLRVEVEGFHPWERSLALRSGEQVTRAVELEVVDHRTIWLSTSLALSAVAAGFLVAGIYYNVHHDNLILETPEADEARRSSIIGYAVAGGVAALALVSWTLYYLHRRRVLRLLHEAPAPGRAGLTGWLSF